MNRQLRPCSAAGCKTLVRRGYCELHIKASLRGASKKYQYLYYTSKWKKYRVLYLMANPFCVVKGCGKRSTVVDHIHDHKGDINKFWDENNHQAMCKICHDTKTARENLGKKSF